MKNVFTSYRVAFSGLLLALPFRAEPSPELSGGAATVFDESRNAFTFPAPNLSAAHRAQFFVGNSFFNQNWVAAPATPASRDGLGPLFVARSCSTCHFKDGRGAPLLNLDSADTMATRLVAPGAGEHSEPKPDPVYGGQLQTSALLRIQPEATLSVAYENFEGVYADGEKYQLRKPIFKITRPAYGPLGEGVIVSPLVAPVVVGLGLLETVDEKTLRHLADPGDCDGDGISGKLNMVWDKTVHGLRPGRFGWKCDQPSIRQQVAAAFNGDMGLTTALFPAPNHTAAQKDCQKLTSGGEPEVSDEILDAVVNYSRTLAVPARREFTNSIILQGERLFAELNCARCHTPTLQTGEALDIPELSHQTIHPYSDLLLHDMGEELSDQRRVFQAQPREWRTPPLWGIGLLNTVNGHTFLLHDGRARNLSEAILWHGGEAEPSREKFKKLTQSDRKALLRFLQSL